MKEKAKGLINDVWSYMEEQVVGFTVISSLYRVTDQGL